MRPGKYESSANLCSVSERAGAGYRSYFAIRRWRYQLTTLTRQQILMGSRQAVDQIRRVTITRRQPGDRLTRIDPRPYEANPACLKPPRGAG